MTDAPPDGRKPNPGAAGGEEPPDADGEEPPDAGGEEPPDAGGEEPPDAGGEGPAGEEGRSSEVPVDGEEAAAEAREPPGAAADGGDGTIVDPGLAGKRHTAEGTDRGRDDPDPAPFPPDEVLDLPGDLTFVRLLVLVALVAFLVDFAYVYLWPGGRLLSSEALYDYQFFAATAYLLAAIPLVHRVYDVLAVVQDDLVHLAGRETLVGGRLDEGLSSEEIDAELTRVLRRYFHPRVLLSGAAAAGLVGLAGLFLLNHPGVVGDDLLVPSRGESPYPHLLTGSAYAAAHGLFAGPLLGGLVLVRGAANEYIVDVDVLAPDGIGGYRAIGDALVSLLSYAVVLLTVDFVVLSSVFRLDSGSLRWPQELVVGIYVVGLVGMLGLTVVAVVAIRNRLLTVRDRKVDDLREEFEEVETAYWEKRHAGEDTTVEAADIRTIRGMFAELNGMSLWPLNLLSVFRIVASVVGSVATSLVVLVLESGLQP